MGSLFGGGGDSPAPLPPPPAPPPPTVNDAARVSRDQADALRRKRGRASSVKTGAEGVGDTPVATKTLVGS
jgi:hypothetical protein